MSMSNHEKNQFEMLTHLFASDDPSLVRKMAKRAKSSEMTRFAREDVRVTAYFGVFISLLIALSAFFNPGNGWTLIIGFLMSLSCLSLVLRYSGADAEVHSPEYSDS